MPRRDDWAEDDEGPELNFGALLTWVGFAIRAMRRHWLIAFLTLGFFIGLAAATLAYLPRAYLAEARILAEPSQIIPNLVASRRRVPPHADQPTRGIIELVGSRPFLTRIIERTNTHGQLLRPASPLARMLAQSFGDAEDASADAQLEMLIKRLGLSIETRTTREVINIGVQWSDPATTLLLAREVVQLLLEEKRANEVAQIRETISILTASLKKSEKRLSATADRLEELLQAKLPAVRRRLGQSGRGASRVMSIRRPAPIASVVTDADEAGQTLHAKLQAKQRELRRVSANYEHEVRRADLTLEQLSELLGPSHPDLKEARRRVAQLETPPKALVSLQAEVELLQGQAEVLQGEDTAEAPYRVVQVPVSEEVYAALNADPEVANLLSEVSKYSNRHDELFRLLENARMENRTAEAAFSFRYTVTEPPVLPKAPVSPKVKLILVAFLLLGGFTAVGLCMLRDLASRRIVEGWQVESFTGLRLLGQVGGGAMVHRRPRTSDPDHG